MIKVAVVSALVLIVYAFMRRNKRLHRGLRDRRRKILDRMSEPPQE